MKKRKKQTLAWAFKSNLGDIWYSTLGPTKASVYEKLDWEERMIYGDNVVRVRLVEMKKK